MHAIRSRHFLRTAIGLGLAVGLAASLAVAGNAAVVPGTSGDDVHFGPDNDNADNPFIQPPGVPAKQHMDNTDVVFGRDGNDLLVGNQGSDTIPGGKGSDILIGGPENAEPNSDVLLGDQGNDINIWAPGDGSDAFVGDVGYDTSVFAGFVKEADGSLVLEYHGGRQIPRVDIGGKPQFSCTIVKVPASEDLGFQFMVRFNVNGNPVVTVRHKDVEQLLCPSATAGKAKVADLTVSNPTFREVWLDDIDGLVGAIVAAP
jgi:Ca2+-binding RTX toxin-like protein